MADPDDFKKVFASLNSGQLDLLLEMARYMSKETEEESDINSNLLTPEFTAHFSNRLLIHHATSEEKFNKKSFEFAFAAASRSAGRKAIIVPDPTNAGADVIVDGTKFSLKTEAAANISPKRITISKLMEARWIRNCVSRENFASHTQSHVVTHLEQYQRIVCLRAFDVPKNKVRYVLVEIPCDLLLKIRNLAAGDFRPRNQSGGSGAAVYDGKERVFSIRIDGSVEKITVSGLLIERCITHGSWTVPTINRSRE